jgi:A/G-specific adenine glycosylase
MKEKNPAYIRRLLLAAYDAGKRHLPWRGETDPYRIWVSEVMLQQTRVETVIPYYRKWVERFPDIDALAEAEEDEVLRVWQGLGYYSRARRLHQGAQVVRERFGGSLPSTQAGLRELPGVGDYTAGAIASIAFGEVVPSVDGNARRVLSRLFDLPNPSLRELRGLAGKLVDPERPGDFNQALMELGALVCLPRSPRCEECPVGSECLALARGTVGERPGPKTRKAIPEVDVAVLVAVIRDDSGTPCVLVRKRPNVGLLAGMWEFPGVELEAGSALSRLQLTHRKNSRQGMAPNARPRARERAISLALELGLGAAEGTVGPSRLLHIDLPVVTHLFSHLKVRYWPFVIPTGSRAGARPGREVGRWVSLEELDHVPLPVAQRKIGESLMESMKS